MALGLVKTFKDSESGLLDVLVRVRQNNGFFELGYPHLFAYCVHGLGLSEAQASYFSKVARKSEDVPELKSAIEQGVLTLSQARRVVPVITQETASDWIAKAAALPQKELEREVRKVNPLAVTKDRVRVVTAGRSELKVGMSLALERKLARVREILGPNVSLEQTLERLVDDFLKRTDPVKKAERAEVRKAKRPTLGRSVARPSPGIPAHVLHAVNRRDRGQCQATMPNGEPCLEKNWVHLHHIVPRARGGANTADNLITLCSAHHRLTHDSQPPFLAGGISSGLRQPSKFQTAL